MHDVWIDRGGTFTDCIGSRSGDRRPPRGEGALVRNGCGGWDPRGARPRRRRRRSRRADVRMGTTLATNALLERKGEPVALAITRGFDDALEIGNQARPDLFALDIAPRRPLHSRGRRAVEARADAGGRTLARADAVATRRGARGASGPRPARASRSWSCTRTLGTRARARGRSPGARRGLRSRVGLARGRRGARVARARRDHRRRRLSDAAPRALPRDARARAAGERAPDHAVERRAHPGATASAGRDAILSGPAGGVVACARSPGRSGRRAGDRLRHGRHLDRRLPLRGRARDGVRDRGRGRQGADADARASTPSPPAADRSAASTAGRFTVGPASAGADPGRSATAAPHARELTLTDVNLALGRVVPDRFPFPLDGARSSVALERIAGELRAEGDERSPIEVAEGFFRGRRREHGRGDSHGLDRRAGTIAREHALVVFGGAGGQHACAVARLLGMRRLLFHPLAGVLSAFGMGLARSTWHGEGDMGSRVLDRGRARRCTRAWSVARRRRASGALTRGRRGRAHSSEGARGPPLPRHRDRARDRDRRRIGGRDDARGVRCATRARARLRTRGAPGRDRDRARRGGWTTRLRSTIARPDASAAPAVRATSELYVDGALRAVPVVAREALAPGAPIIGPLARARRDGHDRGRAGLSRRAPRRRAARARRRARRRRSSRRRRTARRRIRSCSRSSATASCRSPSRWARCCRRTALSARTSATGSTSRAPCSTATAASSRTRRTSRCTSARWASRCAPCSPHTPTRRPATCS